ncbi:MAG TPA: squalene/phytoene synthase family protein, partial [Caulobacteraceae bacterium]|nr:squalene/phytoene synthase family protein [Caulobacteraceae bacterium]
QVINHLQDCAEDYRALDRVYLPRDALASEGAAVEDLAGPAATPGLRRTIRNLAVRTGALLDQARPLARQIRDGRLALEVAVIQRLAESLTRRLSRADPLSERVHHSKIETLVQVTLGLKDRFTPRVAA